MQLTFEAVSEARPGPKWQALFNRYWPAYRAWLTRNYDLDPNLNEGLILHGTRNARPVMAVSCQKMKLRRTQTGCPLSGNWDGDRRHRLSDRQCRHLGVTCR